MAENSSESRRPLSIALMGTRGIPAAYGGFETFAEQLSTRLVERGHEVVVYGRRRFFDSSPRWAEYKGVRIRNTPTIGHKYLDTPLHAVTSFLDLLVRKVDLVLLCNAANAPASFIAKIRGVPLIVNVDGIERRRGKWGVVGKLGYRVGEISSMLFADRVVADAQVISDYYQETYRYQSTVIAYGAHAEKIAAGETLAKFNLNERNYLLYVSRLEPENNALGVIQAYRRAALSMPLVIVGDAPYADAYKASLRAAAGTGVIFTGFQFGAAYHELQSNCYAYIQATEVGGTHPALIEAMAHGNCVIANGTPENREVLASSGLFYSRNDFEELGRRLVEIVSAPDMVASWRQKAREEAGRRFTWEAITKQYESLFYEVVGL